MKSFSPTYRCFSSDQMIWEDVFFRNGYSIPVLLSSDVVIDIGAHTGAFVCACLARGARRIIAFEPDPQSFELANQNVQGFLECHEMIASVDVRNTAVWRSDRKEALRITHTPFSELTNSYHHAAQCTLFDDKNTLPVSCISLDNILACLSQVSLLKMDCEGAEWPILFTATLLGTIRRLVLEVHSLEWKSHELGRRLPEELSKEFGSFTFDDLKARLRAFGLACVGERIRWHFLNNPKFYFGVTNFERRLGPKPRSVSLASLLQWHPDSGGEITIKSKSSKWLAQEIAQEGRDH